MKKYFMIQKHGFIVNVSSAVLLAMHIVTCVVLLQKLQLGVYGLAIASVSSRALDIVIQLTYFVVRRRSLEWVMPDTSVFLQWNEMIKLGLLGALNMAAELLIYEIISIVVQFKSLVELASWVVIFNVLSIAFAFSFGMISSTAILVGISLGEKDEVKTKKWIKVGIINTLVQATVLAFITVNYITEIASLFTDNSAVLTTLANSFWIAGLQAIAEQLNQVIGRGIMGTMGRQKTLTIIILVIGYTVAIPSVFGFAFGTSLGIKGILYAILIYAALYLMASIILLFRTDISYEISKATIRISETTEEDKPTRYTRLIQPAKPSFKRRNAASYFILLFASVLMFGAFVWMSAL